MEFTKPPRTGYGFIYILSNKSMSGILKVGLTTNSVAQRIKELNSTGVPTSFKAEKIFEVKETYLRVVEQSIHNKLKGHDFHHGKEFFKVDLSSCVRYVEDVIHHITGESSEDIVGEAKKRREEVAQKIELEKRILKQKEEYLKKENDSIKRKREEWLNSQIDPNYDNHQFFRILIILGLITVVITVIVMSESLVGGIFLGLIGWFWIYSQEKSYETNFKRNNEIEASKQFPYKSLTDIPDNLFTNQTKQKSQTYQSTKNYQSGIVEKTDKAIHRRSDFQEKSKTIKIKEVTNKAIHGRANSESKSPLSTDEYLSLIKFKPPIETKTWYLSKDGIGHKESGVFIPLVSLVITHNPDGYSFSNLNLEIEGKKVDFVPSNLVEIPKKLGKDDLISCFNCGQSITSNLNLNTKVVCSMCNKSWNQKA